MAVFLLACRFAIAVWGKPGASEKADLVGWRPPAVAESEAKRTRKPLLYDFSATWCGPCQKMDREVFRDAEAARMIGDLFVPVRVMDASGERGGNPPEVEALRRKFRIRAFPTLVVVRPGRDPVVMEGYAGKAETLKALRDAAGVAKKGK